MKEFNKLLKIIKQLRNPISGCPWDKKQTPQSIREYILEEAHELVESIDLQSIKMQKEELGDLLLQIILLSQIHEEKNHFSIRDVLNTINKKLIQRHPHIFGDICLKSAEEVKQNWEKLKKKEKKNNSILSDYPLQMPALTHAKRLAEQASSVGFDWEDPITALEKVDEEIKELNRELQLKNSAEKLEEEIGDILFAVANVSRLAQINPEFALKKTNKKFVARFRYIEDQLKKQDKEIGDTSLDEMESLWQEAKTKANLL